MSRVRVLLIITFLCSLIYVLQYNVNYILTVHANQTPQLPGVKITSQMQNQQIPTGMLSIMGVSTDNSTTDCEVYIILNEIKPYQRVNPTGNKTTEEDHDYSTWNYTFTPDYTTIQEGNNRMVSKITCSDHFSINNENLTKFNSLNVTGVQSLQLPTNTTYSDLVQLQDLDSTNNDSDNMVSNPNQLQTTNTQNDKQDEEGDDKVSNEREGNEDGSDNNDVDYSSSSRNIDEEEEVDDKDFIEELHDRVLDQVREQLRESGIDLPE